MDVLSSFFEILKNKFVHNNEKHIIHLMNKLYQKDVEFYDEKPIRDSNLDLTIKINLIYCRLERFTENCIQYHDYNSDNEAAIEFLEKNIKKIHEFIWLRKEKFFKRLSIKNFINKQ